MTDKKELWGSKPGLMFAVYVNMRAKNQKATLPRHTLTIAMSWLAGASLLLYSTPIMSNPHSRLNKEIIQIRQSVDTVQSSLEIQVGITESYFSQILSYSSRRLFSGLFGMGWCSDLDWSVIDSKVYHCGIKSNLKPIKTIFGSRISVNEKLITFTPKGELLGISFPAAKTEKLALLFSDATQLNRNLFHGHKIHFVKKTSNEIAIGNIIFSLSDEGLVRISHGENSVEFDYDSLHNMIQVTGPSTSLKINYDADNDSINSLLDLECNNEFFWTENEVRTKRKCNSQEEVEFTLRRNDKLLTYFQSAKNRISISYDNGKRISMISNSDQRLYLKYQTESPGSSGDGPTQLHYPGVGSLSVEYGPEGKVKRAFSEQGQEAAREIRGFFNSLILEAGRASNTINQMGEWQ